MRVNQVTSTFLLIIVFNALTCEQSFELKVTHTNVFGAWNGLMGFPLFSVGKIICFKA